jgi:hypothetical protein
VFVFIATIHVVVAALAVDVIGVVNAFVVV